MKKVFALLLIVMLLMTACQPAGPAATVTEPTDPSTEATEPSSEATDPPPYLPENYYIFRFDGEQPSKEYEIDISGLQVGWLYSYDKKECKIHLIADWEIGNTREDGTISSEAERWDALYGYIHFVSADRKTVYRSSYTGEDRTVVYETEHEITHIAYSVDEESVQFLCVTEQNKRAVLWNLSAGAVVVTVEHDLIEQARYYPEDSFTDSPYILWYGAPSEPMGDPPEVRSHIYMYDLETGEITDRYVL